LALTMRAPRITANLALGSCLAIALGNAHSQQVAASSDLLCNHALFDRGARSVLPTLTSNAVRVATCSCLAEATSGRESTQNVRSLIESTIATCMARLVPAQPAAPLPPAVLGRLEELIAPETTTKVFVPAKALLSDCKPAEYPAASRRAEASGKTRLTFHIGANSKVLDGEVLISAGTSPAHKLLDVVALFSIMQCRFEAARYRGQPIDSWTEVEYQWNLE
jgi:hypothetical protein